MTIVSRLIAAACLATVAATAAPLVPRPSSDFTFDIPGAKPVSLSQYKGKTIVLAFMMFT